MPNDDLIITIGALVLGLGLYKLLTDTARAYAVTPAPVPPTGGTPCAAACAPFKNSPATYATCCKQHAAAAPKPKPAPKPATKVYPLLAAKPPSGDRLMHVAFDPNDLATSVGREYTRPNVTNTTNNIILPPTNQTRAPSGGDGRQSCGESAGNNGKNNYISTPSGQDSSCIRDTVIYEPHNHGPRDERGWCQLWDSFGFSGRFIIPDAKDQLTFEFAGKDHSGPVTNRDGYKVGFDETGKGVYLQKQIAKDYGPVFPGSNFQVKAGQMYDITITKQNIGNTGVDITASVGGQPVGHWRDTTDKPLRPGSAPFTSIANSRYGYRQDGLKGSQGPSVLCGHQMQAWQLPNLSS